MPSVVCYNTDGTVVVGRKARDEASEKPDVTVSSAKRLIGRTVAEAQSMGLGDERLTQDESILKIQLGARLTTPVEVSSDILKHLKQQASMTLGGEVTRAVITVPAYFDDTQRQATRQAGTLAGLDILRLVNEPTAAALAYGLEKKRELLCLTWVVAPLISAFSISSMACSVPSTGDTQPVVMTLTMAFELLRRFNLDEAELSPSLRRRTVQAAEAAKIELTTRFETTISLLDDQGEHHQLKMSRDEYEALVLPVLKRVVAPCRQAFGDAGLRPEQLDGVVLVGGSTRSPFVQRFVADLFQRQPLGDIDPDQVVALGATVG